MACKRPVRIKAVMLIVAILAFALTTAARAATITVNSLNDTGAGGICTLRDAIFAANNMTVKNGCAAGTGNDAIQFSVTGTITLASTLPDIADSQLTIKGPASPGITISGGDTMQVLVVASDAALSLKNLTITHGNAHFGQGGGVSNEGTLTVSDSTLSANHSSSHGGGIFNEGTLSVINSTFSANGATFGGGGIAAGGSVIITNSTFSRNSAGKGGGGIGAGGSVIITNSTFSGNGGLVVGGIAGNARVKSTILANNGLSRNCGTITDVGYNISDDSSCGFTKTGSANNGDNIDPLLSSAGLADNGGPTPTIALLDGSPAIDAIPVADCLDQSTPPKTYYYRPARVPSPGCQRGIL